MKLRASFIFIFLLLCFSPHAFAGTTGKIAGVVKDAENQSPLPGANVVIEGTLIGAATDMNGNYAILNIPPGSYTVVATMMGYKTHRRELVRVNVDFTTTIDISLEATVIEGDVVVVEAQRPLIQKDMTASLETMDSEEISNLPVQSVGAIMLLQPAVVSTGGESHIRGGRGDEVATWVDGVPVTGRGVAVESHAIKEIQVVTGAFNAEYGNANSGIVNIITKSGEINYHGRLSAYLGDYVSFNDLYTVLKNTNDVQAPGTGTTNRTGATENPVAEHINPEYNLEAALSGPVPFLKNKVTFFAHGRFQDLTGSEYGRRWFTPEGLPGDSSLVALNPSTRYTGLMNLAWSVNPGFKVKYSLFFDASDQPRSAGGRSNMYVPDGGLQNYSHGNSHLLALTHMLSPTTFYDLKFLYDYSESESYLYKDPFKTPNYLARFIDSDDGSLIMDPFDPDSNPDLFFSLKNADTTRLFWIIDPGQPKGYIDPDSMMGAVPGQSFNRFNQNRSHYASHSSYWMGKFDITSQVTKQHLLKVGLELKLYDDFNKNFVVTKSKDEFGAFKPVLPDVASPSFNEYTRQPKAFSAYIQDKLEYKDIILNIGMRFDYFDANHVKPIDNRDPDIYRPYRKEWKYKNWIEPPDEIKNIQSRLEEYERQFEEYTPEERRAFMHQAVDLKMQVSPRIGIAYPISDQGIIHVSYGHFFQMPRFSYLYARPDFKVSGGTEPDIFGNADLDAKSTVSYEIGLQQQLGSSVGLDVTLYYRDIRDQIGFISPMRTYSGALYTMYQNLDYANSRGITVSLEKKYAQHFSANLYYAFGVVEGTYSDPSDAFNAITMNEEPTKKLVPLDWDQQHQLRGTVRMDFSGWLISLIGRYETGLPYTPTIAKSEATGGSQYAGWDYNIARRPTITNVDFFLSKTFGRTNSKLKHVFYFRIYNLFDQKGAINVYADTGSPDYSTFLRPEFYPYNSGRIGTIEELWKNPGWYQPPRQIQLGYSLEF
ncbi:MAG: TonB-dependent receptor [Candidatus Zhuqueibacterota bacterium]